MDRAMGRLGDVALGVLAVVVVAFVIFVVRRDPEPQSTRPAGADPSGTTSPSSASPSPTSSTSGPVIESVLGIGSAAAREPGNEGRWTRRLADANGWTIDNRARNGIGFDTDAEPEICGFSSCPGYLGVLVKTQRQGVEPDAIVVAPGASEVGRPLEVVEEQVGEFFTRLRAGYPDAVLVVLSPLLVDGDPDRAGEVAAIVEREAEAVDATYVDVGQPFLIDPAAELEERVDVGGAVLIDAVTEALAG